MNGTAKQRTGRLVLRRRSLAYLSLLFGASYLLTLALEAPGGIAGLSTVLGTTVLGTTVLGIQLVPAIASSQLYLSLTCIALLVFLELSDPAYGPTRSVAIAIRENWLPFVAVLVALFFMIVGFKIASIIGF